MPKKNKEELLEDISNKLDVLILINSIQGKAKAEQIKILKNYSGSFSKRDLERITGIDRHEF